METWFCVMTIFFLSSNDISSERLSGEGSQSTTIRSTLPWPSLGPGCTLLYPISPSSGFWDRWDRWSSQTSKYQYRDHLVGYLLGSRWYWHFSAKNLFAGCFENYLNPGEEEGPLCLAQAGNDQNAKVGFFPILIFWDYITLTKRLDLDLDL